jgi:hypothetical protein
MTRVLPRVVTIRSSLVLAASIAFAPALRAQAVILPDKPLDARRAEVRRSLVVLRDSLLAVSVAAARLERDAQHTSAAALQSRARVLQQACASSLRTLPSVRTRIAGMTSASRGQSATQKATLKALDALKPELDRCVEQFGAMSAKGDEVRDYGVRRSEPVVKAVRVYDARSADFARSHDIPFRPVGAGAGPLPS